MNLIIPLPEEGKCLLKAGQKVDFNTPFVEIKKEIEKEILLAEKLNVPAKKIFNYLKKFVGDQVNKDEIIAVKKGVFSDSKYIAEYQGIITEVDHEKGRITIKIQDEKDMIINCYFNGNIQEIKKTSLILEVKQKQEYTLKKCTRATGGEIVYLNEISNETTAELEDKIIAIEEISDINLSKMDVLGVKGIISPMKPPEKETDLPFFQIKDATSFKIIREAKFPYCLTEVSSSKIIFYK